MGREGTPRGPRTVVDQNGPAARAKTGPDRREFLSTAAMAAGLVGCYGAFTAVMGRFLYPARPSERAWKFVAEADRIAVGESLAYRTPSGGSVSIARRRANGEVDDFIALSSICPHLGCQVRWQSHRDRFVCPCHNGIFGPTGLGNGGPPGDAGQSLARYHLKLEKGLLYIDVATTRLPSPAARAADLSCSPAPSRGSGGGRG